MPRVTHVKKARKDNPVCKRGESYYWWKFRNGPKRYSLTPPTRSQLTTSGHLAAIYDAEDAVHATSIDPSEGALAGSIESVKDAIESAAETFRDEAGEYEQSADNVEEYFPGSEKAEEIREKGQACETAADECDTTVDTLQECIDRLEELGDRPGDFEEGEPEPDHFDDESEYEAAHDVWQTDHDEAQDAIDTWVSEYDDIANDAENAHQEFNGVEFY